MHHKTQLERTALFAQSAMIIVLPLVAPGCAAEAAGSASDSLEAAQHERGAVARSSHAAFVLHTELRGRHGLIPEGQPERFGRVPAAAVSAQIVSLIRPDHPNNMGAIPVEVRTLEGIRQDDYQAAYRLLDHATILANTALHQDPGSLLDRAPLLVLQFDYRDEQWWPYIQVGVEGQDRPSSEPSAIVAAMLRWNQGKPVRTIDLAEAAEVTPDKLPRIITSLRRKNPPGSISKIRGSDTYVWNALPEQPTL